MSLLTDITNPATSTASLAAIGQNALFGDTVSRWGNQAYSGGNYLELPGTSGNHGSHPSVTISHDVPFVFEATFAPTLPPADYSYLVSDGSNGIRFSVTGVIEFIFGGFTDGFNSWRSSSLVLVSGALVTIRYEWDGVDTMTLFKDGVEVATKVISDAATFTQEIIGERYTGHSPYAGKIYKVGYESLFGVDFSTFTRSATTGKALTGQTVTINQSGDPYAKITAEKAVSDATQEIQTWQPIYLPKDEAGPYAYLPGLNGNYLSVPSDDSFKGLEDLDIRIKLDITNPADWTMLASKQGEWEWRSMLGGRFVVRYGTGTSGFATGSARVSSSWVRLTFDYSEKVFRMFTSDDGESWSQVEDDYDYGVPFPAMGKTPTDDPFVIGTVDLDARVYRAIVKDGIDGTTVLDINIPEEAQHGDTSFVCSTGQTVTVNQSGDNPASIIGKSVLRTDGVDDLLQCLYADNSWHHRVVYIVLTVLSIDDYSSYLSLQDETENNPLNTKGIITHQHRLGGRATTYFSGARLQSEAGSLHAGGRYTYEVRLDGATGLMMLNGVSGEAGEETFNTTTVVGDALTIAGIRASTAPTYSNHSAIDIEAVYEFTDPGTDELRAKLRAGVESKHRTIIQTSDIIFGEDRLIRPSGDTTTTTLRSPGHTDRTLYNLLPT